LNRAAGELIGCFLKQLAYFYLLHSTLVVNNIDNHVLETRFLAQLKMGEQRYEFQLLTSLSATGSACSTNASSSSAPAL